MPLEAPVISTTLFSIVDMEILMLFFVDADSRAGAV
jgi:hypothetical protein